MFTFEKISRLLWMLVIDIQLIFTNLPSLTHPKSPKAKDNDDEVDDIRQKHQCIDVGGSPTVSMEDIPEETLSRPGNTLETAENNNMAVVFHCII